MVMALEKKLLLESVSSSPQAPEEPAGLRAADQMKSADVKSSGVPKMPRRFLPIAEECRNR